MYSCIYIVEEVFLYFTMGNNGKKRRDIQGAYGVEVAAEL